MFPRIQNLRVATTILYGNFDLIKGFM